MKAMQNDQKDLTQEEYEKLWESAQKQDEELSLKRRREWLRWVKVNERNARFSPWLVIPCAANDYGQRPLPADIAHYHSPAISVLSPDPSGKPLAGADNFVQVRIYNLGSAVSAPTKVHFHWCDPSVGLGADDAHIIGSESVQIDPLSSKVITCAAPWKPDFLNDGHECIFVNCSNHVLDPIEFPFAPRQDRHVGQKNVTVLPAVAQQFNLWSPMSAPNMKAEIRVAAYSSYFLREAMPDDLPYQHFMRITDIVMGKIAHVKSAQRLVRTERLSYDTIVEKIFVQDNLRKVRTHFSKNMEHTARMKPEEAGETALILDQGEGYAALLGLQLRELKLEENEICTLKISLVSNERLIGGYVITLADPEMLRR